MPVSIANRNGRSNNSRSDHSPSEVECLNIALINNMPDSALEDTEAQFLELLKQASGNHLVRVKIYSLPNIPRGDRGREYLRDSCADINDLLANHFDGSIVTGTEPLHADLKEEPYWAIFTEVLDWAERNTYSTVLSCLAAHAGVLHSDGIPRRRLRDKEFGVFTFEKNAEHRMTQGLPGTVPMPHSRWNEIREDDLVECGYTILTKSKQGAVDSFMKEKSGRLILHFQGHPEYSTSTLLKEYRRDIRRFLRQERETYPSKPFEYFDTSGAALLDKFRDELSINPTEQQMSQFPDRQLERSLQNTWADSAAILYKNWLDYIVAKKSACPASSSVAERTNFRV